MELFIKNLLRIKGEYFALLLVVSANLFAQNAENGHKLPARGEVRVLIVFAELVGGCGGTASSA
jgi:hypothetical protein